jgi:hypothetical protein
MSRELMQQALEALEDVPYMSNKDDYERLERVTTALRQALEEKREPLYWSVATGWVYADDTSQERVDETAKQEHEPVAWMHTTAAGLVYFRKKPQDKVFNPQPVYTAPPKKEWVGLTDEEYKIIHYKNYNYLELVQAVEQALKEKNT